MQISHNDINTNENVSMTTSSPSSSSPFSPSNTNTSTTFRTPNPSASKAGNPHRLHHLQKTFFIEDQGHDNEQEQELHQDIDMAETTMTMMQGNRSSRLTRSASNNNNNNSNSCDPLDQQKQQQQQPNEDDSDNNSMSSYDMGNDDSNTQSNKQDITITPLTPSQRLTPQHPTNLQHQHQHQPHMHMQQPAPPITTESATATATAEKSKKRRISLPPTSISPTSSMMQNSHLTHRRRSSTTSWAHGENGAPWSPWSRWRVGLKLLYAVVVPAVIIYLLKNMEEQVACRRMQQQQDNRYFQRSGTGEGGGTVSLWGHHRMTGIPSQVPLGQPTKGSVLWNGGGANTGEQHRCTGGEAVVEPRKEMNSHWVSDGDHQPSC
ncbi:hypothetical protein BKA57DRAFT_444243 [Linnemannia elongata]|nr:hypothetical protein BKA57DRAFT_444243 [Linnemannia elongata]